MKVSIMMLHAHIWCPKLLLTWNTSVIMFKIASHTSDVQTSDDLEHDYVYVQNCCWIGTRPFEAPKRCWLWSAWPKTLHASQRRVCVYLQTCCTRVQRALLLQTRLFTYTNRLTYRKTPPPPLRRKILKDGGEERVCEMKSADGHTHIHRAASAHCACQRRTDIIIHCHWGLSVENIKHGTASSHLILLTN